MISIGYLIGTIIAGIIMLAAVAAIGGSVALRRIDGNWGDVGEWGLMLGGGIVALIATVGIWLWGTFPPFDMQYHSYKPISGTVETVTTRLLSQDKGTTQYYVVKFAGDPTAYRCDDSRCSLLKPGVTVHLKCKREWQYASTPGWTCNYDQEG